MQLKRKPLGSPVSGNNAIPSPDEDPSDWNREERRETDRRLNPTSPGIGTGNPLRRARGRRDSDHSSYVDRYSRRDVALILSIFVMNVGDAFFTMLWLGRGGKEANPIMDFFLDIGPWAFLIQKCIVVGAWLLILLVHKNFRFARIGLYVTLVAYATLMVIHFGIIALGIDPPSPHDAPRPRAIHEQGSPQTGDRIQDPTFSRRVDPPTAE